MAQCTHPMCDCGKLDIVGGLRGGPTPSTPAPAQAIRTFVSGATRDTDDTKLHYTGFLSARVLKRFAEYMRKHRMQADGTLRAPDNWKKGMPRAVFLDSLIRHSLELWNAQEGVPIKSDKPRDPGDEEELLCAIMFNAMGLLHERLLGRDIK